MINSRVNLEEWDEEDIACYKKLCSSFMKAFGRFLGQINDTNYNQICQFVCIGYLENFWKLFVKFKIYKNVSGQIL